MSRKMFFCDLGPIVSAQSMELFGAFSEKFTKKLGKWCPTYYRIIWNYAICWAMIYREYIVLCELELHYSSHWGLNKITWALTHYKDRLSGYGGFYYKDKTVVRPSHLYHGNPYTGNIYIETAPFWPPGVLGFLSRSQPIYPMEPVIGDSHFLNSFLFHFISNVSEVCY